MRRGEQRRDRRALGLRGDARLRWGARAARVPGAAGLGYSRPIHRLLTLAIALLLILAVIVVVGPRFAVAHVAAKIVDARTEAEEMEALCTANAWVHRGFTPTYSVTCEDAAGLELRPWEDGRYDDVALIRLRWSSTESVERRLLSTAPLGCVFGE